MKRRLYLDIDHVLNCGRKHPNGYAGMELHCLGYLAMILDAVPDLKIVLSTSWRYACLGGHWTTTGFEMVMLTHGMDWNAINGRIEDFTIDDNTVDRRLGVLRTDMTPEEREAFEVLGHEVRAAQIYAHAWYTGVDFFVVLDDLPLPMPELIQTSKSTGLTLEDVFEALRRFRA